MSVRLLACAALPPNASIAAMASEVRRKPLIFPYFT
jgi:hypothetical protein